MEPCGTPDLTGNQPDIWPLGQAKLIFCVV